MKKLLFAFAAMFLLLAACGGKAKITLNPQKDAQTYFKFFKVDDMEGGQAYLEAAIVKYKQAGKDGDLNTMLQIAGDLMDGK